MTFSGSVNKLAVPALAGFFIVGMLPSAAAIEGETGVGVRLAAVDRDNAAAGAVGPDVPWSAVVRDIQSELRDLGLYNGPLDGLYSVEVKAAIERFEGLHGNIGDGAPLTDALRSIVSVRDALRLRRTLDEIRERQVDEARAALRASPETRDLLDGADTDDAALVRRAECSEAATVDCLLAEARRAAAGVEEKNFHDWALREIILTEVRIGREVRTVRDRLRQLSDPRLVMVAMREVSEALARDGRLDDALDLAETIPDRDGRVRALSAIAVSAEAAGDRERARRLARSVYALLDANEDMSGRTATATELASGLARAGDLDGATEALRRARSYASPEAAGIIRRAEITLLTGKGDTEREYAAAVDVLTAMANASASASIASSGSAVSRASSAEAVRYRVTTLGHLAVVQARSGKTQSAIDTVRDATAAAAKVRKGYPQTYARFGIAMTWSEIGDFDKAAAVLAGLENDLLQVEGLRRMSVAAGKSGRDDIARDLEARGVDRARGVENHFDRAMLLSDLAISAAEAGRDAQAQRIFDAGLDAGRALGDGWWRARVFARLATALFVVEASRDEPLADQRPRR